MFYLKKKQLHLIRDRKNSSRSLTHQFMASQFCHTMSSERSSRILQVDIDIFRLDIILYLHMKQLYRGLRLMKHLAIILMIINISRQYLKYYLHKNLQYISKENNIFDRITLKTCVGFDKIPRRSITKVHLMIDLIIIFTLLVYKENKI